MKLVIDENIPAAQQAFGDFGEVLVLEGGEVREAGLCAEVFKNPQHAYTQALLASVL